MNSRSKLLRDAMPMDGDVRIATLKQFEEYVTHMTDKAAETSSNPLARVTAATIAGRAIGNFRLNGFAWFASAKYVRREPEGPSGAPD